MDSVLHLNSSFGHNGDQTKAENPSIGKLAAVCTAGVHKTHAHLYQASLYST